LDDKYFSINSAGPRFWNEMGENLEFLGLKLN
jgi:hypothetical protein